MKRISLLGSTGSIGTQTLEIVREQKDIEVLAMSCNNNIDLFEKQIREFSPKLVAVYNDEKAKILRERIKDLDIEVVASMEGLIRVAEYESADIVLTAVVGMIGIEPTIAAIKAGKNIALANKETLCCAGHIIMPLAKEYNVKILPVDSEHSAIFQCLNGNENNKISRILLTASGGPFRGYTKKDLEKVSLKDALKHPNWEMGKKISIDSSTLANKGLEFIEAFWLFGIDLDKIEIVVHKESIIHSMIEFEDGAVMAQLGTADMRLPIQYALYYPERKNLSGDRLDFFKLKSLNFEKPDLETFGALALAINSIKLGGSFPTVFNVANEFAVDLFLKEKIRYLDIVEYIKKAMLKHKKIDNPKLEDILNIKNETEAYLQSIYKGEEL